MNRWVWSMLVVATQAVSAPAPAPPAIEGVVTRVFDGDTVLVVVPSGDSVTVRLNARKDIVAALEQGRTRLGLRLSMSHALRDAVLADGTGDRLDAALCLVQAAWASTRENFGLPSDVDPIEGWIVSA